MCFKDLEYAGIVFRALELKATGAQGRPGSMAQGADALLGFCRQVDEVFIQNPQNSIQTTINFLDCLMIERLGNRPGKAGINHGSRTTRLGDQTVAC